jgi:hypothetical protein
MEEQEIFDKVATHLFTQGCRSAVDPDALFGACLYRGPNGMSCAVGVLIPDELYDPEMETITIANLFNEDGGGWNLPSWMNEKEPFLTRLQGTHDYCGNWESTADMQQALRNVATDYKLSPAVLEGLSFAWETKAEGV